MSIYNIRPIYSDGNIEMLWYYLQARYSKAEPHLCIHTKNFDRANHFIQNLQAGVAVVNAGTFGSEPHMPFGGVKQSGNGTREPGTEALDIYSDLKDVYINISTKDI